MKIIKASPNTAGAYPPIQTYSGDEPPEGYVVVPDDMDLSDYYAYNGFVLVQHSGGVATSISANDITREVWQAWRDALPVPEPEEERPDPDADRDAMLVELEYRLTILELGITK